MTHFCLFLATVLAFTANVHGICIGVLDGCDDCCSTVIKLPEPVVMGGTEYEAFSVSASFVSKCIKLASITSLC